MSFIMLESSSRARLSFPLFPEYIVHVFTARHPSCVCPQPPAAGALLQSHCFPPPRDRFLPTYYTMYSVHIAEVISYILSFSSKMILLLPHFLIVHPLQRLDQCFERIERTYESDPVRLTTLSFLLSFPCLTITLPSSSRRFLFCSPIN
jgi:hypothetical protein